MNQSVDAGFGAERGERCELVRLRPLVFDDVEAQTDRELVVGEVDVVESRDDGASGLSVCASRGFDRRLEDLGLEGQIDARDEVMGKKRLDCYRHDGRRADRR